MKIIKSILHKLGRSYIKQVCKREFDSQKLKYINERPVEYRFIFHCLSLTTPKTVLDIGTGATALPHLLRTCGFLVTATDNIKDYWKKEMFNRHFYVIDDDIKQTRITEKFDFISCVSVLEHIPDHQAAIEGMFNLLQDGGHIVLTFPYNENKYIENVYDLPGAGGKNNSYGCQIFSRREIDCWLENHSWEIINQEYWQIFSGDLWRIGERVSPPRQVDKTQKHQLTCILIRKN